MAQGIATLELTGFDEVIKIFETLEPKLKKKALRPALRAGAKIILAAAKIKAHRFSGLNAKFLKVKSMKRSRKSIGVVIQTGTRQQLKIPGSDKGYYPFSEEYGTKDTPAHPYLRPALKENSMIALQAIGLELGRRQDMIIAKMKKVA